MSCHVVAPQKQQFPYLRYEQKLGFGQRVSRDLHLGPGWIVTGITSSPEGSAHTSPDDPARVEGARGLGHCVVVSCRDLNVRQHADMHVHITYSIHIIIQICVYHDTQSTCSYIF